MIPRTHFHCITTWVVRSSGINSDMHLLILWFRFTSQMVLLSNINFYFDCKTRLCLTVTGSKGKYIFAQESFYLQGILDDINEQDTSFLECKHKHMIKRELHLTNLESCTVSYLQNLMVAQAELILRVITLWFLVLSQFF